MPFSSRRPDLFAIIDPASLKQRSVRGAAVTFGAQIARFVTQFGAQVALARFLTPAEFGLVAMVTPVVNFAGLFADMGFSAAIIQKPELTKTDADALFWINAVIGLVMFGLAVAIAPLVGWFYDTPNTVAITGVTAIVLLLNGLSTLPMALLTRAMRFRDLAAVDIIAIAASAIVGVGAALLGAGYWALVSMPITASLLTLVLSWIVTGWWPGLPQRNRNIGAMMRFGGNVTGTNILNFLARNLDNVLVGRFVGTQQLGLYDRAYKLMLLPLTQIVWPVARVAVPLLSNLRDDPMKYRTAYLHMLQGIQLMALPGIIWAIAFPDQIIMALFGPRWSEAGPMLFWLTLSSLTSFVNNSTGWIFVSQDRTNEQLRVGIISSSIFISSFVIGLPHGAVGVARAYALVGLFIQGPNLWRVATQRGPVTPAILARSIYPFLIAGGCTYAVLHFAGQLLPVAGLPGLAGAGIVSYAAMGGSMLLFPEGRRIINGAWGLRRVLQRAKPA